MMQTESFYNKQLLCTKDLTMRMIELVEQVEQEIISDEELAKESLPIYLEVNQRNQTNNEILWGLFKEQDLHMEELSLKVENLIFFNDVYRDFVNQLGLVDEFDQFMVSKVENLTAQLQRPRLKLAWNVLTAKVESK